MQAVTCSICHRQNERDAFIIFQNEDWTVRHSQETNILGYVLIESRRHYLDLSEANDAECMTFGPLLKEVVAAVRGAVKPERVYTFTLAEVVPHFHVHVIPRTQQMPRSFRGRGILSYPTQPAVEDSLMRSMCLTLKRRLRGFATPLPKRFSRPVNRT